MLKITSFLVDQDAGGKLSHRETKHLVFLDLAVPVTALALGTLAHLFGYEMTPFFGWFPYFLYSVWGALFALAAAFWLSAQLKARLIRKRRYVFIEPACYFLVLAGMMADAAFHTRYEADGGQMTISMDMLWYFAVWLPLALVNGIAWFELHKRFTWLKLLDEWQESLRKNQKKPDK